MFLFNFSMDLKRLMIFSTLSFVGKINTFVDQALGSDLHICKVSHDLYCYNFYSKLMQELFAFGKFLKYGTVIGSASEWTAYCSQ